MTLDRHRLNDSCCVAAVIDAADAQFPAAQDFLKRVIATGRAIGVLRDGVVGAVAAQTSTNEGNLRDREFGSIQPTAMHCGVVGGYELIGFDAGEATHIEVNGLDHGRGVITLFAPFVQSDQKALGHVDFVHGLSPLLIDVHVAFVVDP